MIFLLYLESHGESSSVTYVTSIECFSMLKKVCRIIFKKMISLFPIISLQQTVDIFSVVSPQLIYYSNIYSGTKKEKKIMVD